MSPATPASPVAPALRWPWAALVAVGGGLLTYLAFPGHDLWFFAPLGVGALLVAVTGRRALPAAGLGLLHGLAFFAPLLSWSGIFLGPIAWVPLSVACALSVALAGVLLAWTSRLPHPVLRAVAAAGAWTAVEALLARWPFGGFGWGRLAFSQADAPALGLAAVGGAPLVSFAVALVGALLAQALLPGGRRGPGPERGPGRGRRRRAVPLVAAALVVGLVGVVVPRPTDPQAGELSVAAVQGNVPRAGLDFNAQRRAVLDNHVTGTLDLAQRVRDGQAPAPQLVVWPENSSDIDPFLNADAADEIQAAADAVGVPVVLGAVLRGDEPGTVRNTSLVWEPDTAPSGGGAVDAYDKRHPVPFAEYIPYKDFFRHFTSAVDLVTAQFVAGDRVGRFDVAGARLGVMICFEVVEDGLVADGVADGADLLVVQTNNATFGYSDENVQQLAMSRLRAVEHGRAVVHVSTVGTSALVTPDGALVDPTALYTPAVISGQVPLRTSLTPADRLRQAGVPVEGLLVALGLAGAAGGLLTGRTAGARGARGGRGGRPDGGSPSTTHRALHPGRHLRAGAAAHLPHPRRPPPPGRGARRGPAGGSRPGRRRRGPPHRPHRRRSRRSGRTSRRRQPQHHPPRTGARRMSVLVITPTYDERESLPVTAARLRAAVPEAHLLVVDDDSPDGTGAIADALAADDDHVHVLHRPGKSGLGAAYLAGFAWGLERGYDVLVEMDADGSHAPEQLPALLGAVRAGADLALGSRWVPGGSVVDWPVSRQLLSRGGNAWARWATGVPLHDATGGYRAYRASALHAVDLPSVRSEGYCFQLDLAARAVRAGLVVAEVPITFTERAAGTSKMSRRIVAEALVRTTAWGAERRLGQARDLLARTRTRTPARPTDRSTERSGRA